MHWNLRVKRRKTRFQPDISRWQKIYYEFQHLLRGNWKMGENRWGKRYGTECPVRFGEETLDYRGIVQDLSVFGFFVLTDKSFPVDTPLKLEIGTKDWKKIELIGTVRWSKGCSQTSNLLMQDNGFGILIKTFLKGQEHYEGLCQQLCRKYAQESKSTYPINIEDDNTPKFSFMRRFFSKKG